MVWRRRDGPATLAREVTSENAPTTTLGKAKGLGLERAKDTPARLVMGTALSSSLLAYTPRTAHPHGDAGWSTPVARLTLIAKEAVG